MTVKDQLNEYVKSHTDEKNAEFERKLIFTQHEIFGLKTKLLEEYAISLAKQNVSIDQLLPPDSYEGTVIAGLMIGHEKIGAKEKVLALKKLLPYIDNWGSCDCILSRLKKMESEKDFFISLLSSSSPFYQRFGIVWILKYYLKIDIKQSLFYIKNTKNEDYYLKMAKSWAYAEAFIYDFELTKKILMSEEKDVFIIKKALQKALESYRISDKQKDILRELRSGIVQ